MCAYKNTTRDAYDKIDQINHNWKEIGYVWGRPARPVQETGQTGLSQTASQKHISSSKYASHQHEFTLNSTNKSITHCSTHYKFSSPQTIDKSNLLQTCRVYKKGDRSNRSNRPVRLKSEAPTLKSAPLHSLWSFNPCYSPPLSSNTRKGQGEELQLDFYCPSPFPFPPKGDCPFQTWVSNQRFETR